MIKVNLSGDKGNLAKISEQGELIIRPAEYSTFKKQQITDANAVNFFKPLSGKKLIVSGIIVNADRNVGVNGTLIDVYETSTVSETTIDTSIISIDLAKNQTISLTPLLIETEEGKFINGKADDFNVNISVLGYFVNI